MTRVTHDTVTAVTLPEVRELTGKIERFVNLVR